MDNTDVAFVIGHRNPDTDTIAAALGYAWVLATRDALNCRPARAGEVNAQTAFALKRFGVEPPELLTDAWMRVGQLAQHIGPLSPRQPLLDAARAVAAVRRPIPVVGEDGKPIGIITGAGLFAALNDLLAGPITARLEQRLASPCLSATDREVPVFRTDERVRDVRPLALRGAHDDFPVVDEEGRYVGLVQKAELLAPRQVHLALVDHNEAVQAVPGLEEADIIAVLDHHRLGNLPTPVAIRFKVDPVGSCSTLVIEEALDANLTPPPGLCGMMLCGILSDTLVLRSPTTTGRDRAAASRLNVLAGLAPEQASASEREAAMAGLGAELLAAGPGLGQRQAEQIVRADLKTYQQGAIHFAIAQVEVPGFAEMEVRVAELRQALEDLRERQSFEFALLLVTDVVRGGSRLVTAGPERLLDGLPYPRRADGTLDAPGVVSRKKQLLPAVLAALEVQ
jgi:manganese-dependent inorganic pyrophosphatase